MPHAHLHSLHKSTVRSLPQKPYACELPHAQTAGTLRLGPDIPLIGLPTLRPVCQERTRMKLDVIVAYEKKSARY
jgi:hypothetical protein